MSVATEIIPQITGLIGATVGLGSVVIAYLAWRHNTSRSKPQIKVEIAESIILFEPGKPSDHMLTVKVANYGEMDFTVANLGIKIGKHSGGMVIPVPFGSVKLPYELKP